MKKVLVGGLLAAGSAGVLAQSSVTVYGIVDSFVGFAKGSARDTRLADGGNQASQLGFRGVEDLGGGLSARFTLEAGLNLDSGSGTIPGPGLAFTRQSFVGLESKRWGAVQFGRQYTPIFEVAWKADPLGANAVFSPVILWAQNDAQPGLTQWAARSDNAVTYTLPKELPVAGSLMYAPGEASNNSGNYLGANLQYTAGPLWLGWGYQNKKSGTAAAPAVSPTDSTTHAVAAKYTAGPLTLGGIWGFQGSNTVNSPKAAIFNINSRYTFGASALYLDYGSRDVRNSARDQNAVTLGYDHNLSKRTSLYARYLKLNNKGGGNVSLGGVAVSANSGAGVSLLGVGIAHTF